jgi:cell fate regulator YaaT (PSP1 superfamily)
MEVLVRNQHTRESDLCDTGELEVQPGQLVLYESRYGPDIGSVLGTVPGPVKRRYKETRAIVRVANDTDRAHYDEAERDARDAARICTDRVAAHELDMRVVSAHYLVDRSKLLFFFVSDHRVDFRSLVRDLVGRFHVRVELRQIGVRDETRMVGGIGICGRRICCNGVSDRLAPVSIRMAKDQNYSLNSMKVSGPCGRLLCCLAYEHSFYQEERKRFPREGSFVELSGESYRVHEINVLCGHVRMFSHDGRYATVPVCSLRRKPGGGNRKKRGDSEWIADVEGCPEERVTVAETADDIE